MFHLIGGEFLDTAFVISGPGVYDENVNLAMILLDGIEAIGYLLFVRRIAPYKTGANFIGNLLAAVAATGYRYSGTVVDKIPGNSQSDTACTTCNQRNFSF
jgi:hypothetical protein